MLLVLIVGLFQCTTVAEANCNVKIAEPKGLGR